RGRNGGVSWPLRMGLNVTNGPPPGTLRSKPKKHRARDALGLADLRTEKSSDAQARRRSTKPRRREVSRPVGPIGPTGVPRALGTFPGSDAENGNAAHPGPSKEQGR